MIPELKDATAKLALLLSLNGDAAKNFQPQPAALGGVQSCPLLDPQPQPLPQKPLAAAAPALDLGKNSQYQDAIMSASQRTGMDPAAIASIVNAEAGKNKDGTWNAAATNPKSSARGLTQFLNGSWVEQAQKKGTALNEKAKELGMLDKKGKVIPEKKDELLALRDDPPLSVTTAAEYAQQNLAQLNKQGLVPKNATDDEKAKLAYLAHHEGPGGAKKFLNGTLSKESAEKQMKANFSDKAQKDLLSKHNNDPVAAYKDGLNQYIDKKIQPSNFRPAPTAKYVQALTLH